ncbi:MAG: energy transducer TonB [Acidobacteria bacterium]|nr:energy transducer TonB [Acidobacteriota bacterium]
MGKIVKYCSSCDEGFAEKFGFCPNCAAPLQAFEMNPLGGVEPIAPIVDVPPVTAADTQANLADTILEMSQEPATAAFLNDEPIEVVNADMIDNEPDPVEPEPVWTAPSSIPATEAYSGTAFHNYEPGKYTKEDDGGYYVTVIQEKNVGQRNLLLLGALGFMLTLSVGAYFVSLFQKDIGVGAIGDERSLAMLLEDVPMPVEVEEKKKEKDDGGGGGGGGKNDPKPVNQGDLPDQTPDPIRPPDPKIPKLSNPDLVLPPPSTQGTMKTPKKYGNWGDPNSRFGDPSSGPGSGGGMGTGVGTGAGSGRGTGMGSGNGSGSGSGDGDGNGDGSGNGGPGRAGNPPPPPVGVTSPLRIISNPRATYTEAARTNNVQGSVLVKVTLLASGQVGSVTVVRGLPHGLSEKAIAAAKLIRFEPKKVNGVPVSSTKTMEYTFSIY